MAKKWWELGSDLLRGNKGSFAGAARRRPVGGKRHPQSGRKRRPAAAGKRHPQSGRKRR